MEEEIGRIDERIETILRKYEVVESQVREENKVYINLENDVEDAETAQKILQDVAQSVQQEVHNKIAKVVSRCLESIFDDPYGFKIEFDQKRGKTEARIVLTRHGLVLDDPLKEVGGGVVDVCSFALRLSCLLLSRKPVLRRVLILDEPFTMIRGKRYRERVREMLLSLSEELGVQFILNIDIDSYPEFELGKVIEL